MNNRGRVAAAAIAATLAGGQLPVHAQDQVALADVLRAAARYVEEYERQISAVVAEELYVQSYTRKGVSRSGSRRLRSDMLAFNDDRVGWLGFRDVFEMDGKPVRDRDERLHDLFLKPSGDAYDQAMRIATESARYNLVSEIVRTINIPALALRFISADRQDRSRFTLEDVKIVDGLRTAVVRFDEQQKPRVIQTPDEAAAHGRFWIDPSSGRVVRSEISLQTGGYLGPLAVTIRAEYQYVEKVRLFMPVKMDEEYRANTLVLEGHATYTNFRMFTVDTSTIIKAP